MRRTGAVALAFVSGVVLTGAAVQTPTMQKLDTYVAQVYVQLRGYETELELGEWTHTVFTGSLAEGRSLTVNVPLDNAREYFFLGVCDNDCTDLDLKVYDTNGQLVDEDLELDDYPLLNVSAERTGMYRIEIMMVTCSENPCRFGLAAYNAE
ncbi:MAG TPA: hypothetical protein VMN60_05995 [Longimicrobiales bacterium]|nr:hypothetical protein [Longimicrobiales bacterium]